MNEAEQVLVIILSSALAVFLVLGIITLILSIQVLKSFKRLSAKAEEIGDKVEETVRTMSVFKALASITGVLNNITRSKRS